MTNTGKNKAAEKSSKAFCPSCQIEVEATNNICPKCGWKFSENSPAGPTAFKPAREAKIQIIAEIAIEIDRTGSSEEFSNGIALASELIITPVVRKVREARFWVASHGDLDYDEQHILLTDKGIAEQALNDIRSIQYSGGGDPEEHHLDGIERIFKLVPWSTGCADTRGAIVAFLTAETKPAKSGITAAELGAQIAKKGLLFYLVCQETPTLRELLQGENSFLFPISNTPSPQDMQKVAAQISASIVNKAAAGGTLVLPT
jgi:hypothetical protein